MNIKIRNRRKLILFIKDKLPFLYKFLWNVRFLFLGTTKSNGVYEFPKQKIRYIAIPKNGSSSILEALIKKELANNSIIDKSGSIHLIARDYFYAPNYKKNNFKKITIVRNPFIRIVSCYKNKMIESLEEVGKVRLYGTSTLIKKILGFNKRISFREFVDKVSNIPDRYSDPHLKSQDSFLMEHSLKENDLIIKLEKLGDRLYEIQETFDVSIPHRNKTQADSWRDYYDLETAEKVYKRYKNDFVKYDYQKDYEELINYLKNESKS